MKLDRDEIFADERKSEFLWCLHCERAYHESDVRKVRGLEVCGYEGCDGDTVMDGRDWAEIREGREDEYPEVPVKGKVYPLYPE